MEGNEKPFKQKVEDFFSVATNFCTVTGISLIVIIGVAISMFKSCNGDTPVAQNILSEEQELVNKYVPICKTEIISIDIWEQYTTKQLFYIRNGIYAYEGRYYESGFYDVFDWYVGDILPVDFQDGSLNYYQNKNIANIQKVEKMKKKCNHQIKQKETDHLQSLFKFYEIIYLIPVSKSCKKCSFLVLAYM